MVDDTHGDGEAEGMTLEETHEALWQQYLAEHSNAIQHGDQEPNINSASQARRGGR